jgi:molecular chaperone DnaK (HSP70)
VKSACYDRMLGGRDMDYVVAEHLADDFKAKTKLVSSSNMTSTLACS